MDETPLYAVEREFAHPVERLWHAWTDASALEAWYHPTDLSVVPDSVVSDPVGGGWWTVGVDVPEHAIQAFFYGRYTRVEPLVALEHTMMFTMMPEEFAARDESVPSHRVVVDFEGRGGSSWVRFSQFGTLPDGEPDRAKAGMESYLDSLQAFLG